MYQHKKPREDLRNFRMQMSNLSFSQSSTTVAIDKRAMEDNEGFQSRIPSSLKHAIAPHSERLSRSHHVWVAVLCVKSVTRYFLFFIPQPAVNFKHPSVQSEQISLPPKYFYLLSRD